MHFKTEILLPSATMRCTQSVRDIALRAVEEYSSLFEAYLYTVFVCSKTEHKLKTNFHLFKGHLYTKCAYSKTELESQGDNRSLERHCGQGNRPMSFRGVKRRGNPLNRNKNRLTIAANLALTPTTAQRICAISSSKDKNSCHSCAKLSAW